MPVARSFSRILLCAVALARPVSAEEPHRPWLAAEGAVPGAHPPAETLAVSAPETIRVRIARSRSNLRLSATGPYEILPLSGGRARPGRNEQIVRRTRQGLRMGGQTYKGRALMAPVNPSDFLLLNGRRYRGAFIVEPAPRGRVDVINQLPLEEYLYGVLPREVGADWPLEALKAQAVVSRTYAMANRATDPRQRFDVSNGVSSQVYGGLEDEAAGPIRAVDETRGEILVDARRKPIQTFFHSSCGGHTETPLYVWAGHETTDGFASARDAFCKEDPFYRWALDLSASAIRSRLRRAGIRVGEIRRIEAAKKSPSGRAWSFLVASSSGKKKIQGNQFRMALGPEALRSTLLTDLKRTRRGFHFEGRGWGHGVGLCQWGARGRALAGQTYPQILEAYYPRSSLRRIAP